MPTGLPPQIWLVIAAHNEARVIADVVADLRSAGYRVLIVDDGSTDDTAEVAARAGATVVKHPFNLGQGAALQTGLEFALTRDAELLVTFDADGQHSTADIGALLRALTENNADFALGSRFLGQAVSMPFARRLTLMAATWFTRRDTGLDVTDTHNGLRAMTRRGASRIHLRQNRMAHASEILYQIAESGLKYTEAPVTIHYTAYSLRKGQKLSETFRILVDLFTRRMYR
jgi:polyprenyl-phospho-N-acetylgalactosaminyl synthase